MDDEEMVRGVSEQIMENIDYKMLLARNGKEDIAMIILGMIMSHLDIGEAYDSIREIDPK